IGNLADTFKGEAWRIAGFSGERAQVVGRDAVDALRLADAQGRSAIDQALGHDEGWHHVVERRELAVPVLRSEEHTSELQSLMRIPYALFCLKNNRNT